MKTVMANAQTVKSEWLLVDVADMPLGRAASQIANILRGKHKPTFTPHCDAGDYVVVINTDKMVLTGNKLNQKIQTTKLNFEYQPKGVIFIFQTLT